MDFLKETVVGALSALGGLLAGWFGKIFPAYSDLVKDNRDLRQEIIDRRKAHEEEVASLLARIELLQAALEDEEER